MVLSAQLKPHVGYVQTGEYYAKNGGNSNPSGEEYYGTQVYQQQEDYCPENAYHNNFGSSMQEVRPYPNITTTQPSIHHVVHHEGYDQLNDGHYGKPHGYNDHNSYGYDKHSNNDAYNEKPHAYKEHNSYGYDKHSSNDAYYEKPHGYKEHNGHGYDKHSNNDAYYEKPHGYEEHNGHGYDKHSYGKNHTDSMYGKIQNYDMAEVQGYGKYSNGPNRAESMSYSYYCEGSENKSHQDRASKGAQWMLKSLDD